MLSLKENLADVALLAILQNVQGFYHLIGQGNGKPTWKSEEGGTALGRFSPLSVAYTWYCDTWDHWIIRKHRQWRKIGTNKWCSQ